MPSGGARASIDLSSATIAVTVHRQGATVPILIDGRIVMPTGVAIGPTGQLYVGLDHAAARALPADHRYVDNPTDLLGTPTHTHDAAPPDPVELLAAVLRQTTFYAAHQIGQPITELTLTIPPHWGPRRRGHLDDAAHRAGLPAPTLVTAPAALTAYATTLGLTVPPNSCVLVCQVDRHPATLTVLQLVGDHYRELATQQITTPHDLDHLIAHRVIDAATPDDDPLRTTINHPPDAPADDRHALLESVRAARHLLVEHDRAPVLLPAPRQPAVITRDDVTTATQPFLDTAAHTVKEVLDAADVDTAHLAGVIVRPAPGIPALTERLAHATGTTPGVVDHPHALADGALALTAAHQPGPRAAAARLPRVRLRITDLAGILALGACSLILLLQPVLTADITTVDSYVVGARTSVPQIGSSGAFAMLTALVIAHLAPTTWLAGTPTGSPAEPTTGSLIRRGYLAAAVSGLITATLYGLATGTALELDYRPYLTWTLGAALPLAACTALIAVTAPRIPADALPTWLALARPAIHYALLAAAGMFLMRAALSLTIPVDLTGMPGLVGSLGAALLGAATILTITDSRVLRALAVPGVAIAYALVFTYSTKSALIVAYLAALTWWAVRLTTKTLHLAFPNAGAALHRLVNRPHS
ncbi:hypothetical protein AWW66_07055 [Micromonospora rosaria]|uniref:Heat-shock protein Hsp70 n=1 Tax=Micromonospora rosaria TaxID=47874 RepID=A0A136PWD7_9ACTN|nr:hypothetical protein [Micromonospora rosaria]KXK62673.1 hypothetical protein AWW66_07055 [Micromonospora rosaria]